VVIFYSPIVILAALAELFDGRPARLNKARSAKHDGCPQALSRQSDADDLAPPTPQTVDHRVIFNGA
jgi:hypothetical protein